MNMLFCRSSLFAFVFFLSLCTHSQIRTLDSFLRVARLNNANLRSLGNQILSNQIDSAIFKAGTRTQVNFVSDNLYAPVINGWGYDEIITNLAQVSGMMQASKTILSRERRSAEYRKIALQNQSLRDTIALSDRDLVRTLTEQYVTAYGDQLTMDYTRELFDLLSKESTILKRLAETNVIRQTDFLAFDITVRQQELNYMQSKAQYQTDYLTLNFLSGIVDTSIARIESPEVPFMTGNDFRNSPFSTRFVTDSLRILNERHLVALGYKPSITALTDAGFNSSLQNTPYKNFGFSVGLNLRIPIYDGHQKKLRYQKLDIEENTRQSNKYFFMNQYRQQVAQLDIELRQIEALQPKLARQADYTHILITSYEKLLESGDAKVTDFVTAINNFLTAQNAVRLNVVSRLKIINQLNYWNR